MKTSRPNYFNDAKSDEIATAQVGEVFGVATSTRLATNTRNFLAGCLVMLAFCIFVTPSQASASWVPCQKLKGVECTSIKVPLDYSNPSGELITIHAARKEVTDPSKPWLLFLSGGPGGEGVTTFFSTFSRIPVLAKNFNLMSFDQRGTGKSNALRCGFRGGSEDALVKRCAETIGKKRVFFGTDSAAEDIESLRRQFNLGPLNLFGISYGTRLALTYARAHPASVSHMILDGVVDPDRLNKEGFLQRESLRAVGPSVKALCPKSCRGVSKDPVRDTKNLYARLQKRPMTGSFITESGRRVRETLTAAEFAQFMIDADFAPAFRAAAPSAMQSALKHGNPGPLLRLTKLAPKPQSNNQEEISTGRLLVNCGELALPWKREMSVGERKSAFLKWAKKFGEGAFSPFSGQALSPGICSGWPEVGAQQPLKPFPHIPTIIFQSTDDVRTPPEISKRVANRLPGSQRVMVPGLSHASALIGSKCGRTQLSNFLSGRKVVASCPRLGSGIESLPVAPVSVEAVKPIGGYPLKIGRTLAVVRKTVEDAKAFSVLGLMGSKAHVAGLHGGKVTPKLAAYRTVKFHISDYQLVPGVKVSGHCEATSICHLFVTGKKVSHGKVDLSLSRNWIKGELDGHPVERGKSLISS